MDSLTNRNREYLRVGIGMLVCQALIAILVFFIPTINAWIRSINSGELIVGFISLQAAIISVGLTALQFAEAEKRRQFEEKFIDGVKDVAYCRKLSVYEFSDLILGEMERCRVGADISYFGNTPPTESPNKRLTKSYDKANAIIRQRAHDAVSFRRIIRLTKANWPWIQQLAQQLVGVANYSMAVLEDSGDAIRNPLAVSAQIIDNEDSYLVAVHEHGDYLPYRDVMVTSPILAEALSVYYDRLWSRSMPVVQEGVINKKNMDRIQEVLNSRSG